MHKLLDTLEGEKEKTLHVALQLPSLLRSECGRMGGTGRREVGHGRLGTARSIRSRYAEHGPTFPIPFGGYRKSPSQTVPASMLRVWRVPGTGWDAGVPLSAPVSRYRHGLVQRKAE